MAPPNNLVIATPIRWDEACFSLPVLRAIEKSGGISAILCSKDQELFWSSAFNLPLITYKENSSPSQIAQQLLGKFDSSLSWDDPIPAAAFVKAKIKKRFGPLISPQQKLFTDKLKISDAPNEHRVRYYINTVQELGIEVNLPDYFVSISINESSVPNSIVLSPGSDFGPSYEWPLDHWVELTQSLLEQRKVINIACSIGKADLGKALASRFGSEVTSFQAYPLQTTIPILAANQVVIASDSSLPHIAAITGSTCVTLFGPNSPSWKRPLGKKHIVAIQHVECSPCLSAKCFLDNRCQTQLTPNKILSLLPNLK